ncbi:MAG: hypothetical protein K0Q89_3016 [Thermomicrobiales bacterium]|nr:hypothetical protein [Thermomicrobiales bacterium]
MRERRSAIGRRILSWVFLIVFCLAVPVALVTGWARLTVVDENVYAQAVGRAADDPRVHLHLGVSRAVATRVEATLAGENPSATEALQSRVVAEALGEVTRSVVASEEFGLTWEASNREAHRLLASEPAPGREQPVTLDLSPLLDDIQAEVVSADIDVPPDLNLSAEALRIEVLDVDAAGSVRRGMERLDLAFGIALVVALLSLILSVGLDPDRLAAIGRAGFGLAIAMVGLMAVMLVAQAWLTGQAGADGGGVAIGAILDAISQGLRVSTIALALLGLLVAGLCTGLHALRRGATRRVVAEGWSER